MGTDIHVLQLECTALMHDVLCIKAVHSFIYAKQKQAGGGGGGGGVVSSQSPHICRLFAYKLSVATLIANSESH